MAVATKLLCFKAGFPDDTSFVRNQTSYPVVKSKYPTEVLENLILLKITQDKSDYESFFDNRLKNPAIININYRIKK